MANVLANLARMNTSTAGTGTLTLTTAVNSATLGAFNTFADAGITDGQTVTYAIEDTSGREVGQGVYTSATKTLTRATVYSSTNGGAKLNLSGGAQVFITGAATDFESYFNVKSYGAKGDTVVDSVGAYVSGTDDTAAIQAALDAAKALGGTVYLPRGIYRISDTLDIDESAIADDSDDTRLNIVGDGAGASHLLITAAVPAISYIGGSGGGRHSYVKFEGFRIAGTETTGQHGLQLATGAYFTLRDMTFFHLDAALYGRDILSTIADSCVFRSNNKGFNLAYSSSSRPNNITFLHCEFGINKDCAGSANEPALVRIIGGAIEGNGTNASATPFRGGVIVSDSGVEGAVGLLCDGVYFEANQGTADIYVDQSSATRCHHVIRACSFVRNDATNFVTNNIKFGCDSGTVLSAFVEGNAFKALGTYTPDAARLYIDTASCAGSSWNVDIIGNSQESSVERATTGANLRGFALANANTDITSVYLNNTGLKIKDTNASHGLTIAPGSDLTADRTLTITTGDAARTVDISAGSVTISAAGAALIDDAAASNQRTTLGLGTSAVIDTGTSGTKVPLLDGVNTWSGAQTFNYQTHTFTWSDDGAATGPIFNFVRVSASPTVGDSIAGFNWVGKDSGGNNTGYGLIEGIIVDATDGSEDGRLRLWTYVAGTQTVLAKFEQGLVIGAPTGADKGAGSINASNVYDDNVLLTCMGGELFQSGKVTLKMWDDLVPDTLTPETATEEYVEDEIVSEDEIDIVDKKGNPTKQKVLRVSKVPRVVRKMQPQQTVKRQHKLAHEFAALLDTGFDPLDRKQWLKKFKDDAALPGLPNRSNWQHGSHSIGEMTNKQTLAMEMMAMQIASLHEELEALKAKVK